MTAIGDSYTSINVGKASTRDPKKGYNQPVEKAEDWKKSQLLSYLFLSDGRRIVADVCECVEATGIWRATEKVKDTSVKICNVCKVLTDFHDFL